MFGIEYLMPKPFMQKKKAVEAVLNQQLGNKSVYKFILKY